MGLYPSRLATQDTLDKTAAFLGTLDVQSTSLRRLILESQDGIVRALKAQAVDR